MCRVFTGDYMWGTVLTESWYCLHRLAGTEICTLAGSGNLLVNIGTLFPVRGWTSISPWLLRDVVSATFSLLLSILILIDSRKQWPDSDVMTPVWYNVTVVSLGIVVEVWLGDENDIAQHSYIGHLGIYYWHGVYCWHGIYIFVYWDCSWLVRSYPLSWW